MNNDSSDEELLLVSPENLVTVLSMFFKNFKGNPMAFVPMDEAIEIFKKDFPSTEEGDFEVTESTLNAFMHKINALSCVRMMGDMVAKGLVDYKHDGVDWVWCAKK